MGDEEVPDITLHLHKLLKLRKYITREIPLTPCIRLLIVRVYVAGEFLAITIGLRERERSLNADLLVRDRPAIRDWWRNINKEIS